MSARQYLDNIGNPETLDSISVSDFSSSVQNIIKKWTEEKKRKEKEQEAKAKEEEQSKNKSLGFMDSIIEKVRKEVKEKKAAEDAMRGIEQIKRDYQLVRNFANQAINEFLPKKNPKSLGRKQTTLQKSQGEEAMKDNKHFIIDNDGTPKIIVQDGDTLSGIIRDQCPSISSWEMLKRVDEIAKLNNLKNKDLIIPGQKLKVPNSVLPDVTDTLNGWMREHAKDPKIDRLDYLYDNFKSGGPWDYKSKPGYREEDYHYFIYNGEIINYDDIGNIHYGYVLNAVPWSSEDLTYLIAGSYQNYSDTIVGKDLSEKNQAFPIYGDNTDDYYAVYKGTEQYVRDHNENNSIKRYYCRNFKTSDNTNIYTLEPPHFRPSFLNDNKRFFTQKSYPKNDVFFQYNYSMPRLAKIKMFSVDVSDDISYDEEHQQIIVRHFIPNDDVILPNNYITVQKDEIHGVKVIYEYEKESKNE